ncbi:MAG: phosphodiester glycosidase family protein [Bacillota bacterium]|nr:phosphodiester glycosidase family protein [Bacillota bacterium]
MKRLISILLVIGVSLFSMSSAFAAEIHQLKKDKIDNINVNYVEIDVQHRDIKTSVLNAKSIITTTEPFSDMVNKKGLIAAINGTYFDAYQYTQNAAAYQTIIKNGKMLRNSNGHPVFGFKSDGTAVMDILKYHIKSYNKSNKNQMWCEVWRFNYPSTESDAITLYTPEYGTQVVMPEGAKAVIVENDTVTKILTENFHVPSNGYAIVVHTGLTYLVDRRIKIGDTLENKVEFVTKHTDSKEWEDVVTAVGAGPSLIINGVITANPAEEGFTEDKIVKHAAPRSFIGVTADGTVKFGNLSNATIAEAADVCKQLGLHNAMCLDGGGSVALYYDGSIVTAPGRELNNALAFFIDRGPTGGEMLYKHGFIGGSSKTSMVLNEEAPLTREQLASLILEFNGLRADAEKEALNPNYKDNDKISGWAKKYVAYCEKTGLMLGTGDNKFSPLVVTKGKSLGAVMLRALGYTGEKAVAWADIDKKLAELGIPIVDKELTRGEGFDYIWKVITKPICADGSILGVKLGKLKPEDIK